MDWQCFNRIVRDAVDSYLLTSNYGARPKFRPKGKNVVTPTCVAAFMISDDLMVEVCTGTGMSRQPVCGISVFDRELNSRSDLNKFLDSSELNVGMKIRDHLEEIEGAE